MNQSHGFTGQLQQWIIRIQAGDAAAREELVRHFCDQLQRLTQRMLKGFPGVKRWEQTDDVYQNAMMRLLRALQEVQPTSVRHFLGLAATQIRRELLDLARHYYGPEGGGAHHASTPAHPAGESAPPLMHEGVDTSRDPGKLAAWSEFHQQISALPDEEREVFELLWYHGLSQAEAAALLEVSDRTIKRRWQSARLLLHDRLKGELPGM